MNDKEPGNAKIHDIKIVTIDDKIPVVIVKMPTFLSVDINSYEFSQDVDKILQNTKNLILDFSTVDHIESRAIGSLFAISDSCKEHNAKTVFINMDSKFRKDLFLVCEMLGMLEMAQNSFVIMDTEKQAMDYFSAR